MPFKWVASDFGRTRFGHPLSGFHRSHQAMDTDQCCHPLEVIGEDVQRDFYLRVPQQARQKMGYARLGIDGVWTL